MRTVSVIVPTYNRLKRLKQVLNALASQNYPRDCFEVVVISDGSTDGTHEYLGQHELPLNLTFAIQQNLGPAAARNNGIERATAEIVLFIDDDVVPSPTLIQEHVCTHREQSHDRIVLGPMLTPSDFVMSPWVRWEQAMLGKQYQDMLSGKWTPTARQFYTGNTSLARRHLVAAGGFDTAFRRAEDVELAYRLDQLGLRYIFNASAIGYHYAERSFRSWIETPYAYGRNEVIFTRDRQQEWLLPAIMEEFHDRNPLVRLLVRLCLDRSGLSQTALALLKIAGQQSDRFGVERLVAITHSGMFNLRYYQGIADEMGGRDQFFAYMQ